MRIQPDKEKFLQLMQDHKGIIYKVCNSYCPNKNDREDVAQEIIYHLWKSFGRYDEQLKFSTWMYRIALNVAISFYRKESRSRLHIPVSENLLLFEDDREAYRSAGENMQLLKGFIADLKEIDKSIVLLYFEDKSHKEIAEITGITETNVSTRFNRIKEKLKLNFTTIKNNQHGTE